MSGSAGTIFETWIGLKEVVVTGVEKGTSVEIGVEIILEFNSLKFVFCEVVTGISWIGETVFIIGSVIEFWIVSINGVSRLVILLDIGSIILVVVFVSDAK